MVVFVVVVVYFDYILCVYVCCFPTFHFGNGSKSFIIIEFKHYMRWIARIIAAGQHLTMFGRTAYYMHETNTHVVRMNVLIMFFYGSLGIILL